VAAPVYVGADEPSFDDELLLTTTTTTAATTTITARPASQRFLRLLTVSL